jgi:hypothetical protein
VAVLRILEGRWPAVRWGARLLVLLLLLLLLRLCPLHLCLWGVG